jgi:hypothetical protein
MAANDELHRAVGRIEGKLDTFIAQMKTQDERATDLEVRTRRVESRLHWYSGAGAIFGLFGGSWLKSKGVL